MKVRIINGGREYHALFAAYGFDTCATDQPVDLVCFTGGEDVTPALYGDAHHDTTWNNVKRDNAETKLFEQYRDAGVPMVGICRGAQFLNVMSGGRMYQNVTGHTRSHMIMDIGTEEVIYVSSTHHQMMMPGNKAIIIAESIGVKSKREWFDGHVAKSDVTDEGIEVVYYEHTNALCFQPHPEFATFDTDYEDMADYFFELIKELLFDSVTK